MTTIKYLSHELELVHNYYFVYKCLNCNTTVFFHINHNKFLLQNSHGNFVDKLELSCSEIIIKKLLE